MDRLHGALHEMQPMPLSSALSSGPKNGLQCAPDTHNPSTKAENSDWDPSRNLGAHQYETTRAGGS